MLRKIRITAASIFFVLITMLFLDFTGVFHRCFGWIAKIQFIPALLAVHVVIIVTLVILTLLFGRLYCAVICPLGTFQDAVSNISGRRKGKKNRFTYSPAKSWLRYSVLGLFIIAIVAGISVIVSLLDPYAAFGRMASNFLNPVYRLGNNLLATLAERADSYAFYTVDVWIKGCLTFGIAAATFIVIAVLAWRNGRTYCNTICPVGTVLGFLSKFSIFRLALDTDKCKSCKICEHSCKASCIDVETMKIDHSRCVTCFNCIDKCKSDAIHYAPRKMGKKKEVAATAEMTAEGVSRRNALSILGILAIGSTVKAQQLHVDGGLAAIEEKKIPNRKTPIAPPGASSLSNMKSHCTACQLCISACPNSVLRPSNQLTTLMQPEMSFERGYCRPECTKCSKVCPTGAIKPITSADKSAIAIGLAVWIKDNCVVNTDEVQCNNCQRHCPTGAITLVNKDPDDSNSLKIPTIDKELCIGCGACENLCPARPFSAIYVEGYQRHHTV